jgi:superfamily II RNA helicase
LEQYPNKLNTFTAFTNTNNTHIDTYHIQTMNTLNRLFKDIKVNQTYILNEICKQLEIKLMLPALFFIFSKKRCIELAKNITMTFNDYNEGVEVNRAFDYFLSKLENKEGYKNSYEYNHIKDLALKGIGIHHAGLIPVFKEMIEMLFSKNLIKVLFATETFAVGLNSPIKTVIFSDIYKYDNSGKRRLLTHEFIQMSGRAGRRGIDTIGYVILIPQLFTEETSGSELESLIYGKSQKIISKFNINTDLILNILEDKKIDQLKENIQKSLLNAEIQKDLKNLTDELSIIDNKIKKIVIENLSIYEEYQVLEDKLYDIIKPSQNQIKKIEQKMKDMKKDPIFIKEFDKYKEYILLKKEYKKVEMYYKGTNDYIDSRINSQINILVKGEYITEELELTQKGQIAIKINEVNPLVLTDILISEYLDDLFLSKKLHKIVALFTLVCDGKNDDYIEVLEEYHDVIKFLNQFDILINRELLNPILDWFDGKNSREIVTIYEIHEGDLIKCINKILHLLDEVINVFLLLNKIEYIEIIKEIKNKLNRDIIKMESLYLKIV